MQIKTIFSEYCAVNLMEYHLNHHTNTNTNIVINREAIKNNMVSGTSNGSLFYIYLSNAIASIFSILGCLFIISMYFFFKDLRILPFKIITILSCFDLVNAISFMIPTYDSMLSDGLCIVQGILMNFSTFAAVLWTTFIAITLYAVIVKSYLNIQKLMRRYIIFNLVASGLITAVPNLTESRNSVSGFCWLYKNNNSGHYFYRFLTFLVPLWTIVTINILLYISIFRNLRNGIGGEDAIKRRKLSKKIGIYPFIIILCYLPYSIKGMLDAKQLYKSVDYQFNFLLISGVIRCLIGFFNAIAYGFTNNVKKKIGLILKRDRNKKSVNALLEDIKT